MSTTQYRLPCIQQLFATLNQRVSVHLMGGRSQEPICPSGMCHVPYPLPLKLANPLGYVGDFCSFADLLIFSNLAKKLRNISSIFLLDEVKDYYRYFVCDTQTDIIKYISLKCTLIRMIRLLLIPQRMDVFA